MNSKWINEWWTFFPTATEKNEQKHHLHVESDSVEYVVLGIKMLPGQSSSGAQGLTLGKWGQPS